ncbi:hypothetical protein, partial [Bradyrhizobium sp.]|uniref:hypothetical protein n=1 Tax=Bradyrhizobium sp. TaxID=376 RepID=UPI002E06D6AB|nr:hypothetical protein [Bradyrhizobium sp.]
GYSRGKDIGQDELSAYKATSEAKIPEITSGLLAVNKELRESLKVFERNKTLARLIQRMAGVRWRV